MRVGQSPFLLILVPMDFLFMAKDMAPEIFWSYRDREKE